MAQQLQLWLSEGRVAFAASPPLPLDRLLPGRPVDEVLALVPRLFNLCAAAQSAALRLALDLPAGERGLRCDILRDHLALLAVRWPSVLGLAAVPLPKGWTERPEILRGLLLGDSRLPETMSGFVTWLTGGQGVAPVLSAIRSAFAPGEGATSLPLVTPETAMAQAGVENSPAARQAGHPLMLAIATEMGRGPLWQATGRMVDALACLDGALPAPRRLRPGLATAPASRGVCAVSAAVDQDRLSRFVRRTPTDHLLAPGGGLSLALTSLTVPTTPARARLLVEILDPCLPCIWREAGHA